MARGQESKDRITSVILSTFEGSFMDGKIIRIPMTEGGETVEIKVTLTAAKDVLGSGSAPTVTTGNFPPPVTSQATKEIVEPTEEEVARVKGLVETLGL